MTSPFSCWEVCHVGHQPPSVYQISRQSDNPLYLDEKRKKIEKLSQFISQKPLEKSNPQSKLQTCC